jgi:phosphoglycolate phosphatase-like HAD superfamily hydrolase
MKPGLLALDFDGVVCDGIDEMVESAWRTLVEVVRAPVALSPELRARFAALRPAIETGWEMVVLVGILAERDAASDAELRDAPRWASARDEYVRAHAVTPAALAAAFDAGRARWIEKDASGWLARHRFYPGIAAWLRRLVAEGQLVYVVSTKGQPFIEALLAWQGIALPSGRIIGRVVAPGPPRREKWDVLSALAAAHGVAASGVWFVEDRLATLLEMRRRAPHFPARTFLAEWGYLFRDRDPAAARAAGIPVLDLARATGPFEGWLSG